MRFFQGVNNNMKTFSITRIADLTGRNRRTVERILAGVTPDERVRGKAGLINRFSMATFIAELEKYAAVSKEHHPLTSGRVELIDEQRRALALKNAALASQFVRKADILVEFERLANETRERLLGIPGSVAHELEMRSTAEIETILEERLYEALTELADPDVDKRAAATRNH
ncbi:MAG: hypothetical protein R3D82_16020 [Xanthobacteraceae bacterium]